MTKEKNPRLHHELVAVFNLFVAVFLLLCLISYSQSLLGDQPLIQAPAENWCGSLGFYIAHYLFSFFGLTAFFPVLILTIISCCAFFPGFTVNSLHYVVLGITGLLIAASGLLATLDKLVFSPEYISPGGYLGALIWVLLGKAMGSVGSVLVLVLLLIFSLMAAIRFSIFSTSKWIWQKGGQVKKSLPKKPVLMPNRSSKTEKRRVLPDKKISVKQNNGMPAVHAPVKVEVAAEHEEGFALRPLKGGQYQLPPISLLDRRESETIVVDKQHYYDVSKILENKLLDFNVEGSVEGISPGPVVTTYEFSPAPGVKINRIVSLADDLAMVLKVVRVRIVGSIPGKAAIGIEIPNPKRNSVYLREILLSDEYRKSTTRLSLALGLDVVGRPVITDLTRMPHLLIAGATGAGKSVGINAFIASILYKSTPAEVRFLMIDPKRIELSIYEDIPHLLHPVVVEPKMASRALMWAVQEMERRYRMLEEKKVKSFDSYNEVSEEKMPYIVIIVDELADLMMVASKDVETSIARLAQMARAAGMHIILATQRPSVDVLTGLIKANFPTRISFKVSSKVDSRTIIDGSGAEHLLGAGDMLFLPPGASKLQRIHGAYIDEEETERIVNFLKEQGKAEYDDSVMQVVEEDSDAGSTAEREYDEKYDEAVSIVCETGQASISMVQRRLRVGYNRAARMIEMMEQEGIVGPSDGSRPREVLTRNTYTQ